MNRVLVASSTRSPDSRISAASAGKNRAFLNRSPARRASSWTTMRPTLWRVFAYRSPGLPSPATSQVMSATRCTRRRPELALAALAGFGPGLAVAGPTIALSLTFGAFSFLALGHLRGLVLGGHLDGFLAGNRQVGLDAERGGRDHRQHGVLERREDRDALRGHEVTHVHHLAELHVGDVDDDLVGHVLGQALDLYLAKVVLDHTALLHAGCLSGLVHRHVDGDRLGAAHREEVDMHELGVDVIALDLTRDREMLLAVDHEVDQHVRTGTAVQQVRQLTCLDRQWRGLETLTVEHGWDLPCGAELAGDT